MKKKIILFAAVLVLAATGAAVYVLTNLDAIVEAAVEKFGSEATKTAVRLSSARVRLADGEAALHGLTVADPPGFSFPSVFVLDDIAVRIDVRSVTRTPVVIESVLVSGAEVFYEIRDDGTSNVDVLKKNLGAPGAGKEAQAKKRPGETETRLRVRKLVFEKGKVHVRAAQLKDKEYVVELPRLQMNDIGGGKGAPPGEVARIVATALAEESAKAVARTQGERLLRKGAERMLKRHLGNEGR